MKTSGLYQNMFIIRKMISDAESSFMQNTCNKCMKYRNVQANLNLFTIYGVDMTGMQFQICTRINCCTRNLSKISTIRTRIRASS